MSHSYYRNPRGRMIKMAIMFGSLCFSAYMLPRTIDKLGGSGLASMLQPGGGISPEAQQMLGRGAGEGGIQGLLNAEKKSTGSGPMVITPTGSTTGEAYQRLRRQAQQMAPIKVVKAKKATEEKTDPAKANADETLAGAAEDMEAVNALLELLEQQKKKGG